MGCIWWAFMIPLVDLLLLSRLGKVAGGGVMLVWLVAAGILGTFAIRTRGFSSLRRRSALGPLERSVTFLAGILLIFPGPLSDLLGILLLVPPLRRRAMERIRSTLFGRRFGPEPPGPPGEAPGEAGDPREGKTGRTRGAYPGVEGARDVEFEEPSPGEGPEEEPRRGPTG